MTRNPLQSATVTATHREQLRAASLACAILFLTGTPLLASDLTDSTSTITTTFLDDLTRVLLLIDYNTRLVVVATSVLGAASGLVGSFLLLRKRSLIGDALSHATLPGVCLAFLLMSKLGGYGKWLPGLLIGAALTGLIGVGCVTLIRKHTRLKDDAALGIVLSVFFAFGVTLQKLITSLGTGDAAGIDSFIYGKPASLVLSDLILIIVAATVAVGLCLLFMKEFTLLSFDEGFAAAQGWPTGRLDAAMLALVTLVTVIGLQAVGLILVIALLITPPAAARFWTESLPKMLAIAAVIGAISGWLGASLSAIYDDLPAGAVIVLVTSAAFFLSMLFGSSRGVIVRLLQQWRLRRTVERQHLLRAIYEIQDAGDDPLPVSFSSIASMRSWSPARLRKLLRQAQRREQIAGHAGNRWQLTESGRIEAARLVRNHRLWELYLITHADIAPSHVDRDADTIEHVLGPVMVAKLEGLLEAQQMRAVPRSPHAI